MAATDSAAELEERNAFRFFDLPRELRDMVYTMVYGKRKVFKIKSRQSFNNSEGWKKRSMRKKYVPAAFPDSSVTHLLSVNKQFFGEAVEIWTASKVFQCYNPTTLVGCLSHTRSLDRQILQHITKIALGSSIWVDDAYTLMKCLPRLARVTIKVHVAELENMGEDFYGDGKVAWEYDFSDAELATMRPMVGLLCFRGLKSLTVKWKDSHHAESLEEKRTSLKNQTRAQALLSDVVTRAPETPLRRDIIPTFDQVLGAASAAKRSNAFTTPSSPEPELSVQPAPSLKDDEIPGTEEELLRLVHLRPQAMLKWVNGKKEKSA